MDIQILTWINDNLHGVPFINYIFKFITMLGDLGAIWIITATILFFFKKTRKGSVYIFIGLLVSLVINDLVFKNIIARPRPFIVNKDLATFIESIGISLPSSYSFPSGHSFSSFACATMITMIFGKKGAYSYITAGLIAISRVFICVHYLTDVLAGALLGVGIAIGVYYLIEFLIKKYLYKQEQNKKSIK